MDERRLFDLHQAARLEGLTLAYARASSTTKAPNGGKAPNARDRQEIHAIPSVAPVLRSTDTFVRSFPPMTRMSAPIVHARFTRETGLFLR